MIAEKLYKQILSVIPIICVDMVIRNDTGQYLLVRRENEPLKGQWWIVGGRIQHRESARQACIRKINEELGFAIENMRFLGFYEDIFDRNSFQVSGQYHALSLVFETSIEMDQTIQLDSQHSEWGWFDKLPERLVISSHKTVALGDESKPLG